MSTSIRAAREAYGLSREKVAARIGYSAKTLERWEKGITPIKRMHLIALAEVYEMDVADLTANGQEAA